MKALVLEKRGERAAVLREDGTYTTTKQPCEIGETIELNAEIVTLPRRRKTWARAAAGAVLALCAGNVPVYMHIPEEKITLLCPRENWCSADENCLQRLRDALGAENVVLKQKG